METPKQLYLGTVADLLQEKKKRETLPGQASFFPPPSESG